jgi:multicomponent Na+:H+ antiporter subunit E
VTGLATRLALLVAIWLLAWGEITTANVVTGFAVAALLLAIFPAARSTTHANARPRPLAILRLVAYVARQLVVSNLLVAREIVSPRGRVNSGVIAHELETRSDVVLTLVANIMALTPGTMTVEATREPPVLHVHFLLLDDVASAHRSVANLERLVAAATGRDRIRTDDRGPS